MMRVIKMPVTTKIMGETVALDHLTLAPLPQWDPRFGAHKNAEDDKDT